MKNFCLIFQPFLPIFCQKLLEILPEKLENWGTDFKMSEKGTPV